MAAWRVDSFWMYKARTYPKSSRKRPAVLQQLAGKDQALLARRDRSQDPKLEPNCYGHTFFIGVRGRYGSCTRPPDPIQGCSYRAGLKQTSSASQEDCFQVPRKIENGYETALELVSGADFVCVLHHFSGPSRVEWSRGQVRPEIYQKLKIQILIFTPEIRRRLPDGGLAEGGFGLG